ncbi:MBL fold metallo-hydrolase [Tropicimonas sp. S265A]|uniref:MBL fold metallo-hydrolase n=1 Tax=Tropicimonas sp. S265A TaxID=3415134 RepID=UPI003C7CF707
MSTLTRRQALAAGAAMPLVAATGAPGFAMTEKKGASNAIHRRITLGDFEITTLLAGTAVRDEIQTIFGMNVSPEEFQQVSDANFIPADKAQFFFTPTLVNTGSEVILFDTGLNQAGITAALAEAGYAPSDIDTVVITHMHGDHIGGLMDGDDETFAGASYVTGAIEHNHWAAAGNERFDQKVAPLNDKFTFLDDGGSVASGVTATAAFGHTPGHMTYRIESGGQSMMLIADLANHPVWSLARPDWEVRFDMDKAGAAASRRNILATIADERMPMIGYHMPFPAIGYVATRGDGFEFVPHSYQLAL